MINNRLYLLLSSLSLILLAATPAIGEIRIGYSSQTSSSRQFTVQSTRKKRVTDQYRITGKNVIPINGKNKFNRETIWKVLDADKKFAISVLDENPKIDYLTTDTSSELVQASRRESVNTTVSGFESTRTRRSLNPFSARSLPPVIPVSTSVFDF
jgi:hypothetical protein